MKKFFTCFIMMIIVLSATGCSSSRVNWLTVVCDLEDEKCVRISEEDDYLGYLDLQKLKLYNKNEEIIAHVSETYNVSTDNGSSYGIVSEENYLYDFLVLKDSFGKETYEIYDKKSELLAQIEAVSNDKINVLDKDNNVIVESERNDKNQIVIKVYNHLINEKALVMMVNIYYSEV